MPPENGPEVTPATPLDDGAGTPTPATPSGDKSGGGATPNADFNLEAGFEDRTELQGWVEKQGFKTVADIAQSARDMRQKMSAGVPELPGADATPEVLNEFYTAVGRPETTEGYTFAMPEGIDENFPYDNDAADKFKTAAHNAGLRPEQANALHDWFVKEQAAMFTEANNTQEQQTAAQVEAQTKALGAATKQLEAEFDAPSGSATFNAHLGFAQRFFNENGGDELKAEMLKVGALVEVNGQTMIQSPKLFAAISKAGRALYAEGGNHGGDSILTSGDNPWKKGPGHSVTRQHQIIRADPARAARLKAAAGVK